MCTIFFKQCTYFSIYFVYFLQGFSLSRYQQDHVRLSIQDTFDRYDPPVPPHLYKVTFRPVLDCIDGQSPEEELEAMHKW